MEEKKFVCKYCSKRFPCGKSLGGHIRTHMNEHSAQANEERSNAAMLKFDAMRKKKRDSLGYGDGDGSAGNPTYGLRENPKKTMRFVHSNTNKNMQQQQLGKFCKECGKGFSSLKALCGHMACHSEKEKQKLVMDIQSDTETNSVPRRSKRMKFNNISSSSNNNNNKNYLSYSLANGSSSVSEVEQEQEEVARCLMMLSKDSSYHHSGRFALFAESSDNNSVILEAKSPSLETKFTTKNGKNSVSNAYEFAEKNLRKDSKLKSTEIGYQSDNSDSGYFKYRPKKVDSDDSNDGVFRSEVKSSKVGDMAEFDDYDVELSKVLNRGRSRNTEFKKLVLEEEADTKRFASKKRLIYDSLGSKKVANGFNDEVYKRNGLKYESLNTERDNEYEDDSAYESDENSSDSDSYPAAKPHNNKNLNGKKLSRGKKKKKKKNLKSKKTKEHQCPICNRVFSSGQALGGHKRSHFVGGYEENTLVIRPAGAPCLIDLNLPAPVDE
ncbi:putative transcription factor C2H2 family [Lupinus albus]|uniref:Putative transcription factor C2H2 family n=1 Tax=Lupinus albus TaxID=3870 RepID=A0A6A4PWA6_LUPAL|nr:putative transcription factor C2H2 family [Lupinus albus]